jgi:hypothetical protein
MSALESLDYRQEGVLDRCEPLQPVSFRAYVPRRRAFLNRGSSPRHSPHRTSALALMKPVNMLMKPVNIRINEAALLTSHRGITVSVGARTSSQLRASGSQNQLMGFPLVVYFGFASHRALSTSVIKTSMKSLKQVVTLPSRRSTK